MPRALPQLFRANREYELALGESRPTAEQAMLALGEGAVTAAAVSAVLLGLGTALVYPTLIAAMSDAVTPVARAPVVGVYRFWRDTGAVVAALIAASGVWVLIDMPPRPAAATGRPLAAGGD